MNPLRRWFREDRRRRGRGQARPALEPLESRVVLYNATGNAWPSPQLITISFMPDGTPLGGQYTSNLFSSFGRLGTASKWEGVILQAAQEWAQQTNINFTVVPDNGAAEGTGVDEQGDPVFGDIRIGGFNFGSGSTALASTFMPPPVNNFDIAGDIQFNTGQGFHIGTTYDLFTVAMHEIGHALGLGHTTVAGSVMYPIYSGTMRGLGSDDIAGIRSIYSQTAARSPDSYNSNGQSNAALANAASINSSINTTTLTALVPNLDIPAAGQAEYFSFMAPSGSSTLDLDVQSSGLSLLAPQVTVYGPDGTTVLAGATGGGQYQGTTLAVSVPSLVVGNTYYIAVQGADKTQMGTGDYALGLSFNGGTAPAEASPIVAEPEGNPQHAGGGQADHAPRYGTLPDQAHRREPHGRSRPETGRPRPRPADSDPGPVAGLGGNRRPLQGASDRTDGRRGR